MKEYIIGKNLNNRSAYLCEVPEDSSELFQPGDLIMIEYDSSGNVSTSLATVLSLPFELKENGERQKKLLLALDQDRPAKIMSQYILIDE